MAATHENLMDTRIAPIRFTSNSTVQCTEARWALGGTCGELQT